MIVINSTKWVLSAMNTYPRLLGDIGGTHARFALQREAGGALEAMVVMRCAAHASLRDAIRAYLLEAGDPPVKQAAIGMANPVLGDWVQMTNHHWSFSTEALRADLAWERLLLLNDFTALALGLPDLCDEDVLEVQPHPDRVYLPRAAKALIGAGTGLGVSGLIPCADSTLWVPIAGEGGHTTLAATNAQEDAVLAGLRQRFGHVSAERVLSGPGLVNLYEVLGALQGSRPPARTPEQIIEIVLGPSDEAQTLCAQAVALFWAFLGTTAGNLALTLGARGGVYIGGGIAPRLVAGVEKSRFRTCFESKGRFGPYLQAVPTYVVRAGVSPALLGASRALDGF
jgi:glucokinase